jgi:hypothetical protein
MSGLVRMIIPPMMLSNQGHAPTLRRGPPFTQEAAMAGAELKASLGQRHRTTNVASSVRRQRWDAFASVAA